MLSKRSQATPSQPNLHSPPQLPVVAVVLVVEDVVVVKQALTQAGLGQPQPAVVVVGAIVLVVGMLERSIE